MASGCFVCNNNTRFEFVKIVQLRPHEIGFAVFFFLTRNKFVQCNGYGYNNDDDDNNKFDRDER
ncbi:hypothetical protein DERF_011780 [Dermatophagoides farinae]|uniref:Uncharacterized protein n=1 Tax=Dermatophagoides farinae TaxID=6954 RepID=A0A922HXV0_DERFA|nr:hypothetical protein DERF_011780 [Dermatophagoides farinae]